LFVPQTRIKPLDSNQRTAKLASDATQNRKNRE